MTPSENLKKMLMVAENSFSLLFPTRPALTRKEIILKKLGFFIRVIFTVLSLLIMGWLISAVVHTDWVLMIFSIFTIELMVLISIWE